MILEPKITEYKCTHDRTHTYVESSVVNCETEVTVCLYCQKVLQRKTDCR
jgi:hypothetical protein